MHTHIHTRSVQKNINHRIKCFGKKTHFPSWSEKWLERVRKTDRLGFFIVILGRQLGGHLCGAHGFAHFESPTSTTCVSACPGMRHRGVHESREVLQMSAIKHAKMETDLLLPPCLKYFTFCNITAVCNKIALALYFIQYSIYTQIFPIGLLFY